jgi:GGDEF domain-containing protein
VPSVATPVWAIPLLCANRRLNRLTRELNRLARSDPLSGLPNRGRFSNAATPFSLKPMRPGCRRQ